MALDQFSKVLLQNNQIELVLVTWSSAGPINLVVDDMSGPKNYQFVADPFFRRRNHYLAVGSLSFRVPNPTPPGWVPVSIIVQIANMFPKEDLPDDMPWHVTLHSLRDDQILFDDAGAAPLKTGDTKSIAILLQR
jgi:hypothetical protein